MANPPCMSNDGRPAVFVGTMLETGDAVALCDECLVAWTAALLNVMTGVDPTPFIQAVSEDEPPPLLTPQQEDHIRQSFEDGGEEEGPPPSKSGRTRRASAAHGTADAPPENPKAEEPDTPPDAA